MDKDDFIFNGEYDRDKISSRTYECDLCGKLFEEFHINAEHGLLQIYMPNTLNKKLDLCLECQEKLDEFIGLKKKEDKMSKKERKIDIMHAIDYIDNEIHELKMEIIRLKNKIAKLDSRTKKLEKEIEKYKNRGD